ncbi:slipin family protein [uncultured Microbulbifer sp.]|uniref:slipin family protein n=1 Tax=uncultured Microbulbifer sp. TaxID=348147 RepID=UPI002614393B|nr:slipin family protein [uncultured Microbulbifer sp.]
MKSFFKLWKIVNIADSERALLFRRSRFDAVLPPGRHRISLLSGDVRVETYDVAEVNFDAIKAKFLLDNYGEILGEYVKSYELSDHQVGLFYRDGHLVDILPPGTFRAVWKGGKVVRVGIVDIAKEYTVDEKVLTLLGRGVRAGQMRIAAQAISYNEIPNEHIGLLVVNGKLKKILQPGSYGFWKYNRSIAVKLLDMRLQTIQISAQEILTKDRISLRINLSGNFRITQPQKVALKLNDYKNFIYRELQFSLREAVGTQTLDSLLADKDRLNIVIATDIRERLAENGIDIASVGVKDIILPGDMKMILSQVAETHKESEANLLTPLEETKAVCSLQNTAKVMDGSPVLPHLKELESLKKISACIDKASVHDGLDGEFIDSVKLRPTA